LEYSYQEEGFWGLTGTRPAGSEVFLTLFTYLLSVFFPLYVFNGCAASVVGIDTFEQFKSPRSNQCISNRCRYFLAVGHLEQGPPELQMAGWAWGSGGGQARSTLFVMLMACPWKDVACRPLGKRRFPAQMLLCVR